MASVRSNNRRRRSRSASNTSPITRHSLKRTYPMCIDNIQGQDQTPRVVVPSRRFPSSSADFNLFPKSPQRADCPSPRLNDKELTHLRSKAFWELHRSVAENGEGFVRRMREYEHIRSRQISDPSCRNRKRVCRTQTTRSSSYMPDSDVSDDDDIQMFAGELPNDTPQPCHPGKWVTSPGVPNSSSLPSEGSHSNRSGYILPIMSSSPYTHHRAGEGRSAPANSNPATSPSVSSSSSTTSSAPPHTPSQRFDVDDCSVPPLSSSLLPSPSFEWTRFMSPEKVVSDLGLALANGAGSINDYNCIENLPTFQQTHGGEPGELWH